MQGSFSVLSRFKVMLYGTAPLVRKPYCFKFAVCFVCDDVNSCE